MAALKSSARLRRCNLKACPYFIHWSFWDSKAINRWAGVNKPGGKGGKTINKAKATNMAHRGE
jgi:hypothetical protein